MSIFGTHYPPRGNSCVRAEHGSTCPRLAVASLAVALSMAWGVSGDDDSAALRDTLQSLCSLNSVGKFASACRSVTNWGTVTLDNAQSLGLVKSLLVSSGSLTSLFVYFFSVPFVPLFPPFSSCVSRSFKTMGLTALGSGVFSSLSNLKYLNCRSPPFSDIPHKVHHTKYTQYTFSRTVSHPSHLVCSVV